MFKYIIVVVFFLFSPQSLGEDNFLTLKQQLDRLQREVTDLSQLVFQNGSKDNDASTTSETSMISAFDMRIYDLEKDIKNLNANFEDLSFQLDDLSSQINELKLSLDELNIKLDTTLINQIEKAKNDSDSNSLSQNLEDEITNQAQDDNTLGTLKISSEDMSEEKQESIINSENDEISPDEQFQIAFDLLLAQQFEQAKTALIEFISVNSENELAGSAHYWLGEIHLLKKDFREAALIFAEGYQKYPNSVKAPDSLFKLAEALSNIDKREEACNTLSKFTNEHDGHKLTEKVNNKSTLLECE